MIEFLQERNLTIEGLICGFSFGFIIGMNIKQLRNGERKEKYNGIYCPRNFRDLGRVKGTM